MPAVSSARVACSIRAPAVDSPGGTYADFSSKPGSQRPLLAPLRGRSRMSALSVVSAFVLCVLCVLGVLRVFAMHRRVDSPLPAAPLPLRVAPGGGVAGEWETLGGGLGGGPVQLDAAAERQARDVAADGVPLSALPLEDTGAVSATESSRDGDLAGVGGAEDDKRLPRDGIRQAEDGVGTAATQGGDPIAGIDLSLGRFSVSTAPSSVVRQGEVLGPVASQRFAGDADATGAYRPQVAVQEWDAQGCMEISGALRIRHSTAPATPDLVVASETDDVVGPAAVQEDPASDAPVGELDPGSYEFPFRVPENPGMRTYADMQWCPGSLEPPPEAIPPIHPLYRVLFVVGAQKAGTTWLHHALSGHPAILYGRPYVQNAHNPRKDPVRKELQFFNTWPARSTEEFLTMWSPRELALMRNGTSHRFLFDGSPEYLLNAAAAPRIKQMVPQAKIVIVLRDPTERAFSSWGMKHGWKEHCDDVTVPLARLCVERSFEATFNAWHNSFARPECRFSTPGANVSWGDCFGCRYNLFRYRECCALREEHGAALFPCFGVPRGFSVMDYSSYAAQIAWWLEFFPPEQIYIVTSEMLFDKEKRVQVLNELIDFVGLPDSPRFSAERVNAAAAFTGNYKNVSPADVAAKAAVRRFHAPQVRDLRALLARFFPHVDASALDDWLSPEPGE